MNIFLKYLWSIMDTPISLSKFRLTNGQSV